jgi:hypothetical protein
MWLETRGVTTPICYDELVTTDHVEGFLMKQEFTCAQTYKLHLNDLVIKILQFEVQIWYLRVLQRKLNEERKRNLLMIQGQHLALRCSP